MKKYTYILLTILWMVYIFYMSHQVGVVSSHASSDVTNIFLQWFPLSLEHAYFLESIIRKIAHILEYAILAWLLFLSIKSYSKHPYLLSFISAVLYASSDEFHQSFIFGRSALFTDVIIDSTGVLLALLLLYLYYKKKK